MPYRYAYPAASYKDYPTEWGGVAQGVTQGIANAASILGTERAQEDQAMKRDLAAKTAAEYEYMNKPVTTVGAMINAVPDMDDEGRKKLGALAASYGYGPDDPISRKHMSDISRLVNTNPIFADVTAAEKRRFLQGQLAAAPDDATKQAITNKLNLLNKASKEMELKEREVKSKEKTAEAATTKAEKYGNWQQVLLDPDSTEEDRQRAREVAKEETKQWRLKHPTVGAEKPMSDAQIFSRQKLGKEMLDEQWVGHIQGIVDQNLQTLRKNEGLKESEHWAPYAALLNDKNNIAKRASKDNFRAFMSPESAAFYNKQHLMVENLIANGYDPREAVSKVIQATEGGRTAQPATATPTTVQTWTRDAQGRPVRK